MTRPDWLAGVRLFVLDMDGTIYLGDRLFEATEPFLHAARALGKRVLFFTNNASRAPEDYLRKLARMGIPAGRADLLTSGDVMVDFLNARRPGKSVYLVGTPALRASFERGGVRLCGEGEDERADAVVVSFDTTLTYEKLSRACAHVRAGAEFLSTHPDFNCPVEGGFVPDSGAICAAVTASTGREPRFVGKPYPETMEAIERRTGVARGAVCTVGDRLYTDVALGARNGARSVLVLSGESSRADVERSADRPDLVVEDIGKLGELL